MHPIDRGPRPSFPAWAGLFWLLLAGAVFPAGAALPTFDFRLPGEVRQWVAQHDLANLTTSGEGMVAQITGGDPYLAGPMRNYPAGTLLWLNVRLRSDAGGTAQVFYYRDGAGPTEPASVRFAIRAGEWVTARVPMPALGTGYRLRIDPPGTSGRCVFERLWFDERVQFAAPAWPKPVEPVLGADALTLTAGDAGIAHARNAWGAFAVMASGRRVAIGQANPLVGYVVNGQARWWSPAGEGSAFSLVSSEARAFEGRLTATDADGAHWEFRQRFTAASEPGTFDVWTAVKVDRERALLHWPALVLFPGVGTVGPHKQQGLLAGVEYLEDEPSSSEADLEGPQARRQVTDTAKLTFPLAAVIATNRYVGLTWTLSPEVAVLFDSPDRFFQSGGHVVGLIVPGSDGINRDEGSLVPYDTRKLAAGEVLEVRGRILAGTASNAVPVVEHYVRLAGWPEVPGSGWTATNWARLAASGWLDSAIREGNLYRHAAGASFSPQPAADAAADMEWLAGRVGDAALATRLRSAAAGALGVVPASQRGQAGVGHVRYPLAPLVFGGIAESADTAAQVGRGNLARFTGDGTIRYVPTAGGLNYARTHWTNEANGLAAPVVVAVLEAGLFAGDRFLVDAGLRHLRGLAKFRGTVPRGAQTWEIPLHTPDILASAHLVRAYTLGYEITGEPEFLAAARYWAWTGVPFVYLRSPYDGLVGTYATTPVLGATQWVAPNWIGLPVQWCGLVYADAIARLARHDPAGPWRRLADGISASGVQQTYPAGTPLYAGLLPDSYSLGAQQRNPANINPGTLIPNAARWIGGGPLYDSFCFRHQSVTVHGAGEIEVLREDKDGVGFRVRAWPKGAHRIYLTGVYRSPLVRLDGVETALVAPHRHTPDDGRLILEVTGSPRIDLELPARTAVYIERRPGGARLSWPVLASPLELETAAGLGGVSAEGVPVWGPAGTVPVAAGDRWIVNVSTTDAAGFFRLHRPGS